MSREKQIVEEMKKDLCECHTIDEWAAREYGEAYTDFDATAQKLYAKGWSKQSEWVSVEERLPELYKDVITYDMSIGVGIDSVLSNGEFVLGRRVTHWMPFPEAPKMKGGAE